MVKYLLALGVAVMLAWGSYAAIPSLSDPAPKPEPLGPNDYVPPLTTERADQLYLVDPRPEDERTCQTIGVHWANEGCQLRTLVMGCFSEGGEWSQDTHTWKFDGFVCRYLVESEYVEAPREASK